MGWVLISMVRGHLRIALPRTQKSYSGSDADVCSELGCWGEGRAGENDLYT